MLFFEESVVAIGHPLSPTEAVNEIGPRLTDPPDDLGTL
jgi:hypothetical protein